SATRRPSSRRCRSWRAPPVCSRISRRSGSTRSASSSRRGRSNRGMTDPERLSPSEQRALDEASYRDQLAYLLGRSPFYRRKLAGHDTEGGLDAIAGLPLTEKSELKATSTTDNPVGAHLCVDPAELVRIYSTSGTTGSPSYVPLTAGDLENWVTGSARSYAASGVAAGDRLLTTYNAGPFVAGAALDAFERIGVTHIPVGTGTSERLLLAINQLRPDAVVLTPSYAEYLLELADLRASSVRRVLVAGEPGGGERTTPRIRCVGRSDDMVIVRGVNVFPSAVREVVGSFAPGVSGRVLVRPRGSGVKQEPPLPIAVELARDASADAGLADAIRAR